MNHFEDTLSFMYQFISLSIYTDSLSTDVESVQNFLLSRVLLGVGEFCLSHTQGVETKAQYSDFTSLTFSGHARESKISLKVVLVGFFLAFVMPNSSVTAEKHRLHSKDEDDLLISRQSKLKDKHEEHILQDLYEYL